MRTLTLPLLSTVCTSSTSSTNAILFLTTLFDFPLFDMEVSGQECNVVTSCTFLYLYDMYNM